MTSINSYLCSTNMTKMRRKRCNTCRKKYDAKDDNIGLNKGICVKCNIKGMKTVSKITFYHKCTKCGNDYDSGEDNIGLDATCLVCNIGKLRDMECNSGRKSRCADTECMKCFNKSFASHEKAKFWHPTKNGEIRPRDVALNSNTKYWFKCGRCKHDSEMTLVGVNTGRWCRFCVNLSRCDDLGCKFCFEHSFASHKNAKFWHPIRNKNTPRNIALRSPVKYWFKCGKCKHEFEMSLSNVTAGCWCRFCANKSRCDDADREFCFKHSFAGHERAKFWHPTKNKGIIPRDVALNSGIKYWFKCGDCEHDFEAMLSNVIIGHWCGFCANLFRCNNPECEFCFKHSFANHEKAKFWHPTRNGGNTPRDVALRSCTKYWFKCEECGHDFEILLDQISANCWCKFCANSSLCNNPNCEFCFEHSFASHENAKLWHPTKNEGTIPRDIILNSGIKYWFRCGE
jgi:hypothetical protein